MLLTISVSCRALIQPLTIFRSSFALRRQKFLMISFWLVLACLKWTNSSDFVFFNAV